MFFALLIAAVAPVTADPDADTDEVRRIEIRISERAVQRESNSVRVTRGEYVEMLWQSDEAVKLHLHGYDIEFEITPEKPAARSPRDRSLPDYQPRIFRGARTRPRSPAVS
jgi:hypothetical protein